MIQYTLPPKATAQKGSFIREIFERGQGIPGFISFGIGNPASEAIPVKIIQQAFAEVVNNQPLDILQYGPMVGSTRLAEQIVERLVTKKNMPKEGQGILISSGSGHCLGLVPRTLCSEGDEVFMDEYTFTNGISAPKSAGAVPVAVAMDDDGMIPEALEEAAKSGKGKYIYLIPNFQNPTGITMSEERRRAIYEVAKKHNLFIYEDDPYGELRFTDTIIPSFKEMDTEDLVLYAGSFSKTLSAGLRVGFLYGPEAIINAIQSIKSASDGQMPMVTQLVVSKVLDTIDYDEHLKQVSSVYKEKYDIMSAALNSYASNKIKLTNVQGGMFTWMTLPDHVDPDAFFNACMDAKVGIITSAAFSTKGLTTGNSFRLSFSYPTKEKIEEGARILGEVTKRFCD